MTMRELNADLLIGRRVYALNGRSIGRLQDIRVEMRGGECVVTGYLVGVYGLAERLAATDIGRTVLRTLAGRSKRVGYTVPWRQLDLTDSQRPRLRCPLEDLPRIDEK
jgi:sporulation protein YlmC with PRC-barrel domain